MTADETREKVARAIRDKKRELQDEISEFSCHIGPLDLLLADAAIAAYEAAQWRPIESAPKEGVVLLYSPHEIVLAEWDERGWFEARDGGMAYNPTHWRPLPPPPA